MHSCTNVILKKKINKIVYWYLFRYRVPMVADIYHLDIFSRSIPWFHRNRKSGREKQFFAIPRTTYCMQYTYLRNYLTVIIFKENI